MRCSSLNIFKMLRNVIILVGIQVLISIDSMSLQFPFLNLGDKEFIHLSCTVLPVPTVQHHQALLTWKVCICSFYYCCWRQVIWLSPFFG